MSAGERFVGVSAAVMVLCCAVLPFAGAALGGGLIAGAGTVGVIVGVALLAIGAVLIWRGRRDGGRC